MTKKQKITIASVAGACVLVLAAAIVCIVLFVGGGDNETEPASVSTVSSLEFIQETVPVQSDTENTQSTESAAESETKTVSQAEQTASQSTAAQQATQTTTPATTSTSAAATTPTTSTPASTTPPATSTGGTSNSGTSTGGSGSTGTSLEQQIAEFDARAPQIIQLAYQKLAAIGVTAVPNAVDPNTNCWTGNYGDPILAGHNAPWEDWDVSMDWDNDRCAEEFVELIQSMWELDGRKITGVQIEYLGVNYGTYQDNQPTFRVYNWQ